VARFGTKSYGVVNRLDHRVALKVTGAEVAYIPNKLSLIAGLETDAVPHDEMYHSNTTKWA
jgi:hypothetical protein